MILSGVGREWKPFVFKYIKETNFISDIVFIWLPGPLYLRISEACGCPNRCPVVTYNEYPFEFINYPEVTSKGGCT